MYITIVFPLMRAYNLSMNEYATLETIRALQNSERYDFWCIKPQSDIADGLGVTRQWMCVTYSALLAKGLVKLRKKTGKDTAVRVTDEWSSWFDPMNDQYLLYMKTQDVEILSGDVNGLKGTLQNKLNRDATCQLNLHGAQTCQQTGHLMSTKLTSSCQQTGHNTNIDINKDTNINIVTNVTTAEAVSTDQEINMSTLSGTPVEKEKSSAKKEKEFGNKEINEMLLALKGKVGVSAFVDSNIERFMANHCLRLMRSLGRNEFVRRLNYLLLDPFHQKNCNKIKYVYNNIKGFIEPNIASKTLVI